jgi:hypothetical protein
VDAEAAPLPDQRLQRLRGNGPELVVAREQHLELVEDQNDPRQTLAGRLAQRLKRRVGLRGSPQQRATPRKLRLDRLKDADAELAIALDRDRPRVRQRVRRVHLELDALLEVDQMQLKLLAVRTSS